MTQLITAWEVLGAPLNGVAEEGENVAVLSPATASATGMANRNPILQHCTWREEDGPKDWKGNRVGDSG